MKKRNILIFTQRVDSEDPILQFFQCWIREFAKHFDTVYVICLQKGTFDLPKNVIVRSLGKESGVSDIGYILRFYRYTIPLIAGRKVDKVFVHMNEIYVLLLIPFFPFRQLYGIKTLWWKTQAKLGLFAKSMRFFVTKIFTASEHGFKVKTSKTIISGHGIDTEYFKPAAINTPSSQVRMIAVGRAIPVKNYELIIEAAAILKQTTANFHIDIVGARPEDQNEYLAGLRRKITDSGLEELVEFKPPVPFTEMVDIYQQHNALINVTYPYTFDKVSLEAMSCGVIPITPTPTFKSILGPHNLFPQAHTPEELAHALQNLIALSAEERQQIGASMRQHILDHHNVVKLIERISNY